MDRNPVMRIIKQKDNKAIISESSTRDYGIDYKEIRALERA